MKHQEFRRNLTAQEAYLLVREAIQEIAIPATERVLNDAQLCALLNISKRTSATWRATGILDYHKVKGVIFYLYSDVLKMLERYRVEHPDSKIRIAL